MATYYKYAERNVDSQVNWAEVGKGISDMLADEVKIREEKKAEIDKNTRDFQQTLQTAPQGQFQDANKFTNDYAHSMMEQQMIDTKLLKAGKMKLQDYTLRRQNYIDGTNVLFDLQKLYQENYKNRMDGIQTDELQALNGFNMASVEGFGDFSKSRAVINSATGIVSVGIMKPNPETGVMELTDDVVPVNVLKGKILATIPTWKADEVMNNTVKGFGDKIRVLQTIATQTKAGSITELTGVGALEASKDPQFKADIEQFNKAVDEQINSYFSNPYHITSVLTQNLKKYNQESYTFDKDIAQKDSSKILLKINQSNGLPTLDTEAPSYKAQELEARDWVKSQLLSKMDSKVKVDLGGFAPQPRQPSQYEYERADARKAGKAAVGAWNQLYTGKTAAEKQAAADILLGTPKAQDLGLLGIDVSTPGRVKLSYADSKKNRDIPMIDASGKPISIYDFAAIGTELHGITDRNEAVKASGGGSGYGSLTKEQLKDVKATREGGGGVAPVVNILPELFTVRSGPSTKSLQSLLGPAFKVTDMGGPFGNDVEVVAPNGQKFTYNANLKKDEAAIAKADLEQFIKVNGAPVGGSGGGGVDYGNK